MAIEVNKNVTILIEMNGSEAAQLLTALKQIEFVHHNADVTYGLSEHVLTTVQRTIKALVSEIGTP